MKKHSLLMMIIMMLIPLLAGALSALLSYKGMAIYGTMNKPPLSPPPWVFSFVWSILYLLMGLASYFVLRSANEGKALSLILYFFQLLMNFVWSLIFFNGRMYLLALIWLIIMTLIVIMCTVRFYTVDKRAAFLMFPYILWLLFATYLNMGTCLLN